MTRTRERRLSIFHVLFLAAPLLVACSGSSDGDPMGPGGGGGETQTASASATPTAGTVTRGGATVSTTVVHTATGGLVMSSTGINKPFPGISVNFSSTQTTSTSITRVYTIAADATVPVGNHAIRFSAPISNYTGNGSVPTSVVTYTLTVN